MFSCSGWDDSQLLPYAFMSLQGLMGDLLRSLGKDATMGNVLEMLDQHYGVMMTFDALSKGALFPQAGNGENVAKFRICLSQKVQIFKTEYPSRIQQEHVEEVKQEHYYEDLSPKYWQMLAHMVDGENPVTYSKIGACCLKAGKMGKSQRSSPPKTHYCWEFKHNSFSLTRKSISIQEVEG